MAIEALTKRQKLDNIVAELKLERASYITHWRELSDYIQPRRARFTLTEGNRGDRRSTKIIDSTGVLAARTQAAGMMSGLTNPARPWFRLTSPDPDLAESGPVKEWLHVVTQRMNTAFSRSNLYKVFPLMYADLGVFGTSAISVLENNESIMRCTHFPIGSYMLANDEDGRVNTFARELRMTVAQLVSKFGGGKSTPDWTNISNNTKTAWERNRLQTWVDVIHLIIPNDNYDGVSRLSTRKKYYQCYFEAATDKEKILEESGYDEFPILAPRWEVTGEDVYGTNCPGMTALPDIKQLQHGEKRSAQSIDKTVNPPMKGPPSMRTVKSSILPGDVTYTVNPEQFTPVHEMRQDIITPIERKQEQVRYRIQRAFFEDLFLMLGSNPSLDTRRDITAREIDERHEEKLLALGPVLEQVNDDALDPLIDRTFAIMQRGGYIPQAPPELEGAVLKVEYISVMAQAQKMVGLAGLERFAGFVNSLAEVNPQALDKIDSDQMIDEYGEMTGVPPRIIVPDEDVIVVRQERAKQQQAEAAALQAESISKSAKNLATSPTNTDNALTELLRSQQPGISAEPQLVS